MWLFPQIELNTERLLKERFLFLKIIVASILIHTSMVVVMFLGHVFFSAESLILGKSGARVSMTGGKPLGLQPGSGTVTPAVTEEKKAPSEQLAQKIDSEQAKTQQVEPVQSKQEIEQIAEKKKSEQSKPAQMESKAAKPNDIMDLPKKMKESKKVPEKKEEKPKEPAPVFSELKKKFTSLKKQSSEKAVPEQKKPALPEQVKVKQVEQKTPAPKTQEPLKQVQKIQEGISGDTDPTYGGVGAQGFGSKAERIEFAVDEPVGSDNVIVQEIEHHYRRPPGFDDHEPFVFTFEIKNGKATTIGPKGSEPLVIYSAIKEAVLKASFAITKQSRKIELMITSK